MNDGWAVVGAAAEAGAAQLSDCRVEQPTILVMGEFHRPGLFIQSLPCQVGTCGSFAQLQYCSRLVLLCMHVQTSGSRGSSCIISYLIPQWPWLGWKHLKPGECRHWHRAAVLSGAGVMKLECKRSLSPTGYNPYHFHWINIQLQFDPEVMFVLSCPT